MACRDRARPGFASSRRVHRGRDAVPVRSGQCPVARPRAQAGTAQELFVRRRPGAPGPDPALPNGVSEHLRDPAVGHDRRRFDHPRGRLQRQADRDYGRCGAAGSGIANANRRHAAAGLWRRRTGHARARRLQRLLRTARNLRRAPDWRWLLPHRRPGAYRCRRLRVDHRQGQGPDHPGRREHLPGRIGERHRRPPRRGRCGRHRLARRAPRRAALCRCPDHGPPNVGRYPDVLRSRGPARRYWPERLESVEHFPRTAAGKIKKHELQSRLLDRATAAGGNDPGGADPHPGEDR